MNFLDWKISTSKWANQKANASANFGRVNSSNVSHRRQVIAIWICLFGSDRRIELFRRLTSRFFRTFSFAWTNYCLIELVIWRWRWTLTVQPRKERKEKSEKNINILSLDWGHYEQRILLCVWVFLCFYDAMKSQNMRCFWRSLAVNFHWIFFCLGWKVLSCEDLFATASNRTFGPGLNFCSLFVCRKFNLPKFFSFTRWCARL